MASSLSRAPLVETDVNTASSSSLHVFNRGWWSFKAFSARSINSKHSHYHGVPSNSGADETIQKHFQSRFPFSVVISCNAQISLASLLSQVCVGPLQSISVLKSEPRLLVLLEFSNENQTTAFRSSIRSGRLLVNGIGLRELPIPAECAKKLLDSAPSLVSEMKSSTCRRSLELFQEVDMTHGITSNGRPTLIQCEINPVYLKQVFSYVGCVIQVRPMIYHCYIAYAIDFANIGDAIKAKALFDEETMRPSDAPLPVTLRFRDLHEWRLEFSKDVTERRVTC